MFISPWIFYGYSINSAKSYRMLYSGFLSWQVYSFGCNSRGQLGDGTTELRTSPVRWLICRICTYSYSLLIYNIYIWLWFLDIIYRKYLDLMMMMMMMMTMMTMTMTMTMISQYHIHLIYDINTGYMTYHPHAIRHSAHIAHIALLIYIGWF